VNRAVDVPSDRKIALALAHAATGLIVGQGVVFYGLVVRARLELGEWPRPHPPDPVALPFRVHANIAAIGGGLVFFSPLLAVILVSAARGLGLSRSRLFAAVVAYVVSYVAAMAVYVFDPGGFGAWFLD
jgi:hypothetical protein